MTTIHFPKPAISTLGLLGLFLGSSFAHATEATGIFESRPLYVVVNAAKTTEAESSEIESYHYGETLDVQEVISITKDSSVTCAPVPVTMLYKDSQGVLRKLNYQVFDNGCQSG
ncbi:uncharacterized protein DUF2790 [Azomonas agilis]|uniref:Uncharacterized protein DUF2790 n=1 Tax=Azomonas agilis TaxID=116849 RepID=A0A562IYH6_9GAMM|nr:DUF2790 domain-containing protein [Azomonas agilis]TWH75913.1 uncharacterized protein DUF2790 [Azomonas agilis]